MPGEPRLRRRRGAALRRPPGRARRASRHDPGAGEHPRPDRGRRGARPRRERHEGGRRRDDRARRGGAPGRYLFFTREEVPVTESPLPALFASGLVADAELAVVLEPTDCILHAGCLGNIQARVHFHGESAHSARPWTGVNASTSSCAASQGLVGARAARRRARRAHLPRGRERGAGRGRHRPERRPRAPERRAELPLRARPLARRGRAALRSLVPHGEIEILSNSPSAPPALGEPAHRSAARPRPSTSRRSRRGRRSRSSPSRGIDADQPTAPGLTRYAHPAR